MITSDNNYYRKLIFPLFDLNTLSFQQNNNKQNRQKNKKHKDKR